MDRTKEYSFVLSTMPRLHACSRLLGLGVYLLLAECEVHMASYGPSFYPSFYGPSAKRAGHENKEGKKTRIDNLPYELSK